MSTLRSIVSSIRGTHRVLSTDNMLTDRLIAAEVIYTSLLLIKRETNLRKLWATDTLFTTIPCLEMIEVPISECGGYVDDLTISRSKDKIPKIAEGTYNYVIQGVYSINVLGGAGKKLKEISVNRYLNILKLSAKKEEEYFFINNDYLYVTSAFVKAIRLSALFSEEVSADVLYAENICGVEVSDEDYCMNPLDRKFFLPGYLEAQVTDMVSKKLRETYFQIQQDVSSEGIDGQQINSTPTD